MASEFQILGVANEKDLQPYFFNFADGIVILSFLMVCIGLQHFCYIGRC